jgi:serine protease Do
MYRHSRRLRRATIASAVLLVGCGRGDAMAQERTTDQPVRERLGDVPAVVDTTTATALSQTFRAAAATALPSVVTVQVTARPTAAQFPFRFPFGNRDPDAEAPPQFGTGSGFVFTEEGHIVTNNHVVENATSVQIRFPDGRIYDDVEIVGRDPNSDIAVVKISSPNGFTPLDIGDSDALRVGDWVLALGNPLQLGFTVTAGIVSAKGRNLNIIQGDIPLESFIQTDAAINRGNSGGPLVDLYGRVVGINTAIYSPTGTYAGNGFAVPSAIAVKAARDIIEYGYVRRPRIGVVITPVGEAQAELYGLDQIAGALVSEVQPDGPAADAGLRPEDVIVSVDGVDIRDSGDLITRLARRQPGEEVTLGVVRDRRPLEVDIELGEFDIEQPETRVAARPESAEEMLGITVIDTNAQVLRELDVAGSVEGVVVTEVSPYGPAAGILGQGDIILEFNRERVRSVADLRRLASAVERGDVVVVRLRSRQTGNEGVRSFRVR